MCALLFRMWSSQTPTNVSSWMSSAGVRCTLFAGPFYRHIFNAAFTFLLIKTACVWRAECASYELLALDGDNVQLYLPLAWHKKRLAVDRTYPTPASPVKQAFLSFHVLSCLPHAHRLSSQRWIKGSVEDLHTASPSDRQREAQTHPVQIWEVGDGREPLADEKQSVVERWLMLRLFSSAAAAQRRQTTSQRESDSAMKALTNGWTLTDCDASEESKVEVQQK